MSPQELFKNNTNFAYWYLNKMFPALAPDEDIQQEALLGLWMACTKYDENQRQFTTFASVCIRNQIFLYLRKVRKRNRLVAVSLDEFIDSSKSEDTLIDWVEDPSANVEAYGYDLQVFLQSLSKQESDALQLHMMDLKQTDAAKRLGVSQSYYSRIISRIKKRYLHYDRTGELRLPQGTPGRPRLRG